MQEKLAQVEVELQVLKEGGGKQVSRSQQDDIDGQVASSEEDDANAKF